MLKKIISSGQTGADMAGIDAAIKNYLICLFGIILPLISILLVFIGNALLLIDLRYDVTLNDLTTNAAKFKEENPNGNDYALFSLLYIEHANQKIMVNKQTIKLSVILIGVAVISIGIMMIILNINVGGMEGHVKVNGFKFGFNTATTGVAFFIVGVLMIIIPGLIKHEYQTASVPTYRYTEIQTQFSQSLKAYSECKEKGDEFPYCFTNKFEQINYKELK